MNNTEESRPPEKPKRRYKIWIVAISFVLILGVFYVNNYRTLPEISNDEFERMIDADDVKKISLIKNQEIVEITLRPEAFRNPEYQQYFSQTPIKLTENGPHLNLRVAFAERFDEQFETLRTHNMQAARVDYEITTRENYVGVIVQWAFLFLILFCFWMFFQVIGSWLKR